VRPRGQTRVLAPLLLGACIAVTSCGSAAVPTVPAAGHVSTLARHTVLPRLRSLGTAVPVVLTGTTLVVAVKKVIDPLTDSGARVPAGMVAVGVLISARDVGPENYDSSATSDFELRTPAGRAMPVFAPSGVCQTTVQDFMNELGAGVSRMGCIAYAIPHGQTPTTVRFSAYGGHEGPAVSWAVVSG
jgi:hypothetical protein